MESILAVMVVITASSVFLVVLGSGALQVDEEIDQGGLVIWLAANGLYSESDVIPLDGLTDDVGNLVFPEDISGITVVYRGSGSSTPLLIMNRGEPSQGDVLAFQLPLLIEVDGRNVPGVMEVLAWR